MEARRRRCRGRLIDGLGAGVSLAAVLATKQVAAGRMGGTVLGALARALTDSDDAASATEALAAVVNDADLAETRSSTRSLPDQLRLPTTPTTSRAST